MPTKEEMKKARHEAQLFKQRQIDILQEKLRDLDILNKSGRLHEIYQDIALEVEAIFISEKKHLTSLNLMEEMNKIIEIRYKDFEGIADELKDKMPSFQSVCKWRKKEKWKQRVWDKCKETGFFTASKKADVMQALYDKAVTKGDTQAIKLYLSISGDYQEKVDVQKDAVQEAFREINEKLHGKK